MAFAAGEGDLRPVQSLPVGGYADVDALRLVDGTLLDVQLEEGAQPARPDLLLCPLDESRQLVAEPLALGVLAGEGPVHRVHAGVDARGQHGRRDSRPLFGWSN